jgi:hypothetical protein
MKNKINKLIIEDAYEKALLKYGFDWLPYTPPGSWLESLEAFTHKCETDKEFCEKIGV